MRGPCVRRYGCAMHATHRASESPATSAAFVASRHSLCAELKGAKLGDRRLTDRLQRVVGALCAAPDMSFPRAMENDAALEGTYRFLSNKRVKPDAILEPHHVQSAQRVRASSEQVIVAHDTSELNYGLFDREGLGRVGRGKARGVYIHVALAVTRDTHAPLGTLAVKTLARKDAPKPHLKHGKNQNNPDNEARRWPETLSAVANQLGQPGSVIHVMDREADDYTLFAHAIALGERFVVRQYRARTLTHDKERCDVRAVLNDVEYLVDSKGKLSTKRPSDMPAYRKRHPARTSRVAILSFRASQVTLPRPVTASERPELTLTLNLVHVLERNPPVGCDPVEWWLWTNEPVDTGEQILNVVDAYRARWVIEEFFKALKTGCAIEARQLETKDALLNALAIFIPIAWHLLALRQASRQQPSPPASTRLNPVQLACLRAAYLKRAGRPLPEEPTARDALEAIAKLGGHLRHNGPPGWLTIQRGYETLLTMEAGYRLLHDV